MRTRSKRVMAVGALLVAASAVLGQNQAMPIAGQAVDAQAIPPGAVRGATMAMQCVGSMSWNDIVVLDAQLAALRVQRPPRVRNEFGLPMVGEIGPGLPGPRPRPVVEGGPGVWGPAPPIDREGVDRTDGLGAPQIVASFEGLPDNHGSIPPDTMGAVGPFQVVTHTNQRVRVQLRDGSIVSTVNLDSFWSIGSPDDPFDPVVIYDALAGRYIACVNSHSKSTSSKFLFAISRTADATGIWDFYAFDADPANDTWADYPRMGYNGLWIAITQNMFAVGPGGYIGVSMWVLDHASAVSQGGSITYTRFDYTTNFDLVGGYGSGVMTPAITHDPDESTLWIVDSAGITSGGNPLHRLSRITGTGVAPVWSVAPGGPFPGAGLFFTGWDFEMGENIEAHQFGTSTTIETGDWRIQDVEFRNGSVWYTHGGMIPSNAPNRTCVFWHEIDPHVDLSSTLLQSAYVDAPGQFHFFPSLAVNNAGDMLLGFSRSSSAMYAQAAFTYRLATDSPATTRPVEALKAGTHTYTRTASGSGVRWGDYSATCVDPIDDRTMWTIQEWADEDALYPSGSWGTWWGQFGEPVHVWVAFWYSGTQWGTFYQPYTTLANGVAAIQSGGTIGIEGTASSPEALTINKHVVLRAFGGPSTIGQ